MADDRPRPSIDPDGRLLSASLCEKIRVPINGALQGMILKSTDVTKPVLLYLHGGMPDYFLTKRYPTGIFLESLGCREYTLREKFNLWRGKATSGVSTMWTEMLGTNLAVRVPKVDVPVYFLHGRHDLTCSFAVAREYFASLEAPGKGFYTFEDSAHSPLFEEPERCRAILREDVLTGRQTLADADQPVALV